MNMGTRIWDRGIAVDTSHSEKKKRTEYQGIDVETGEVVFYKNIGYQTNNIGEFLAIVDGIKYVIEHNIEPKRVFSDSTVAMSWVKNKSVVSTKHCDLVDKALVYLRTCAIYVDDVEIIKWNNKGWGETPADFGRK